MKLIKSIKIIVLLSIIFTYGCANKNTSEEKIIISDPDLIVLTKEQFDAEKIETGVLTTMPFLETVYCNGIISTNQNGIARISSKLSGTIESINYSIGSIVNKGDVIFTISSRELIILQQEFLEVAARLENLKQDYERKKVLNNENIGSTKEFLAIKSEYKALSAKYKSLKMQLQLLKLNTKKILDGEPYISFNVTSPISGYITQINTVLSQYIEPNKQLVEIINTENTYLQLSVFEKDISNISVGLEVEFNLLDNPNKIYNASIISIGKSIENMTKSVLCLAKIEADGNDRFTFGAYAEANIIISKTDSYSLPKDAVIKSGNGFNILIIDSIDDNNYYLKKLRVKTGNITNKHIEIVTEIPESTVITKGAYNLISD